MIVRALKNLTCSSRVHYITRRYASTKVQTSLQYPFNFDGMSSPAIDRDKSIKIEQITSGFLDPSVKSGFIMAYKSYCEALANHDIDFIREICEPKFALTAEKALLELKQKGCKIEGKELDTDVFDVFYKDMTIFYGIDPNRLKNRPLKEYQVNDMNFLGYTGLKLYISQFSGHTNLPFMQIEVVYRSPLRLILIDETGESHSGHTSTNIHRVRFENFNEESESSKTKKYTDAALSFRNVFGMMGMGGVNKQKEMFQSLFLGDNYSWKIVDVDEFMLGNPHAV